MGGSTRPRVIVTTLVLLPGLSSCSSGPLACTLIGAVAGLSITLAGTPATTRPELDLEVCTDEGCTAAEVILSPGSSTAFETCTPDGTCSATSVPDGTLTGFVDLPLPEEEVQVDVALVSQDGTTSTHTAAVRPEMVHPNGERCGGEAVQASLILDDDGLRQD